MSNQPPRMIDANHIAEQARRIRDVAQDIIVACQLEDPINPYSRNMVTGGQLAQEAAVLGIMLVQYEMEQE